jgi:hypothetical protein
MQAVAQSQVEIVRLYDDPPIPTIPWKFSVEDNDDYWPVGWLLYSIPTHDGDIWIVKRESPKNVYVKESSELVGVRINGELVLKTVEWNNEIVQIWRKDEVLSLFEAVVRGKYSGVAICENWSLEEREKAEKWHKLMYVIKALLEDEDRISRYGEYTFLRYAECYYSKWLVEFKDLFEKIAKMEEGRITFLKNLKRSLWNEGFRNGYFMYVYYP